MAQPSENPRENIVNEILKNLQDTGKYLPITVDKPLDLEYDLGNLMVSDHNDLSIKDYKSSVNSYLLSVARDNTQLLINALWNLPTQRVEDAIVATLPKPTYLLPREKVVPKARAPTRWEKYAKEKGITKKKKDKKEFDEVVKDWVPTFGYKKAALDRKKDWLLEVPLNADQYEDQFAKGKAEKDERKAKNEFQRLRNIAKSRDIQVPAMGITSLDSTEKRQLSRAVTLSKVSTASLGNFQPKLPKEKPQKGSGKKRKFEPLVMKPGVEKQKNLDILLKINNKKPKLDVEKAVNRQIFQEETEASETNKQRGPQTSRRSKKGGKRGKPNPHAPPMLNRRLRGIKGDPGKPAKKKGKGNKANKNSNRKREGKGQKA